MESWDIAYEPRTGRRNHRATFPHLSSFLRFVFSFSFCGVEEHQPRITFAYTSHYRQDSLFGPNACESIELKRILSLKLSLRWKKEVKFFLYTFFFPLFSLKNDSSNICTVRWLLSARSILPVELSRIDFEIIRMK